LAKQPSGGPQRVALGDEIAAPGEELRDHASRHASQAATRPVSAPRLIAMSFISGEGWSVGGTSSRGRVVRAVVEQRKAVRSDRLCTGTLACRRCDAPIAIGAGARPLTDRLTCPFCRHEAPARDFLSLARPTRPARVEVRVRRPADISP
jgi:hypothetical protein